MKRTLQIKINCGEKTCASVPGKFCRFCGSRRLGSMPVCMLFPAKNPGRKNVGGRTDLEMKDGWTQRCDDCLKAEINKEGK